MSRAVRIFPCGPIDGSIQPPGSKSITNRALICAALANGQSTLRGVLDSEDTQVMIHAWNKLGLSIRHDLATATLEIDGVGIELPCHSADLHVANSGTTIRFLTAALSTCHGDFRLDGVPRMRERPIGDLLETLRALGADVTSENKEHPDCPPVLLKARGLAGGHAEIAGDVSSQFLSGVMLAAPMARSDVRLTLRGHLVSKPYIDMTRELMIAFGARVTGPENGQVLVTSSQKYLATDYTIEPDASAASYFWAAAAIAGGVARVQGLTQKSLQGDVRFCEVLAKMGCHVSYDENSITVQRGDKLVGVDVDMADISDTVQTLAAVALFAQGPTRVCGVAHNRVKETDRISDLATELRKLGAQVDEFHDGLTITPGPRIQPATIETYRDHRMAMSMALVGLAAEGIEILDPSCTSKTYPNYWEDLSLFASAHIQRID
ncbi:MAG: 3-phosphoshikimate 1-carboxyvinyltransferase [Planctomycetales bacterium]|nr:3-phosphoshikimate 1-carboxyvinyltransferase [Planctomycetales bacterium]